MLRRLRPLACALTLLQPATALAEVMDKEPSPAEIWERTALFIVLGILLARWKTWLPLVVWPLSTLFAAGLLFELHDPHDGPAILQEAGWNYVVQDTPRRSHALWAR
jgi:hypothetical protein